MEISLSPGFENDEAKCVQLYMFLDGKKQQQASINQGRVPKD